MLFVLIQTENDSTNDNFWGKSCSSTYHSKKKRKLKQATFQKRVELRGYQKKILPLLLFYKMKSLLLNGPNAPVSIHRKYGLIKFFWSSLKWRHLAETNMQEAYIRHNQRQSRKITGRAKSRPRNHGTTTSFHAKRTYYEGHLAAFYVIKYLKARNKMQICKTFLY